MCNVQGKRYEPANTATLDSVALERGECLGEEIFSHVGDGGRKVYVLFRLGWLLALLSVKCRNSGPNCRQKVCLPWKTMENSMTHFNVNKQHSSLLCVFFIYRLRFFVRKRRYRLLKQEYER